MSVLLIALLYLLLIYLVLELVYFSTGFSVMEYLLGSNWCRIRSITKKTQKGKIMKKSLYTILDEKAHSIGPVFQAVGDDEAERIVSASFPPDSLPRRYPADFALLRLGDIQTDSGVINPHAVPVLVRKLDEVFPPAPSQPNC